MRILFLTLVTSSEKSGIYYYINKLINSISVLKKDSDYTIYVLTNKDFEHEFENISTIKLIKINLPHYPRWIMRPLFFVWLNTILRLEIKKHNIDVIHFPNPVPILFRYKQKLVVTIHDIAEFQNARFRNLHRLFRRFVTNTSIRNADSLITVSEFSKEEIVKTLKYSSSKIVVTPLASRFSIDKQNKINTSKKYILHLGGMHLNKNVPRLLEAFSKIKQETSLYLVGNTIGLKEINKAYSTIENIKIIGFLDDKELKELIKGASIFIYPSLYEGFGLPILEAMALGVPVITSNRTSMPEVAGDAALYVNPENVEEIAEAISRLLQDDALRASLIEKGYKRVQEFSWEKTAALTIQAYKQTLSND